MRLLIIVLLTGCGTPHKLRIVDENEAGYATRDVEVPSLEDIDTISGSVVEMLGGASMASGMLTGVPPDRGADRASFIEGGEPVSADWTSSGDVAVANDFETLTLFTAYAHFDQAASYFMDRVASLPSEPLPCYYAIEMPLNLALSNTDNAAYVAGVDVFILLPMSMLQDIPLGMNPGVIAHEYAHRVFYYNLWNGELMAHLEAIMADPQQLAQYNLLRALDEGNADFFAATISGNPRFLLDSVNSNLGGRDLTASSQIQQEWLDGTSPSVAMVGMYDPYAVGVVIASTLWRISQSVDPAIVVDAVLAAQAQIGSELRQNFHYSIGDFETEFINQLPAEHRATACTEFEQSHSVVWNRFSWVCPL